MNESDKMGKKKAWRRDIQVSKHRKLAIH
jgi:hypothetical protein